ncbi:MAG: hypothetical protein ACW98I_13795 [Candidatus Hodarchaeales archaeon]|jgi:hypothetical protein
MNNPEIRVPLIIKWIKGHFPVFFLVLVISLIVSPTLHLEISVSISDNPTFLDDEGAGTIELIKITKEGSCLIFYTGPRNSTYSSNETYVRVLQLYLNGSSSYITPRYPAPVIKIGLIQEDDSFYRLIGWDNGSLYEILYDKKLRAIEIIERGHFFDFEESCGWACGVYSSEKYEWGINDYMTIGYFRNDSHRQLDLVKVDGESVNLFRVLNYSDEYHDLRFYQFNNTLGFCYYADRNSSFYELIFQEVIMTGDQFEFSGSMKITTNNSYYHRFMVGNGIPYSLIYDTYFTTELTIVNLLNKQAKVIEFNSYPDLYPYLNPSSVLFDSNDIIHLFVYHSKTPRYGGITRFEYTQLYPNGSVKLNRELDSALLESHWRNYVTYPETIQAIGSDLIVILGTKHFSLLNRVNGSIISFGNSNIYKWIPEDKPIDIILVVLFGVLILGVIQYIQLFRRKPS